MIAYQIDYCVEVIAAKLNSLMYSLEFPTYP